MKKTYIDGKFTVTVNIPDRTPEEQAIRDKEIETGLIALYRKLEREGRADFLKVKS